MPTLIVAPNGGNSKTGIRGGGILA